MSEHIGVLKWEQLIKLCSSAANHDDGIWPCSRWARLEFAGQTLCGPAA